MASIRPHPTGRASRLTAVTSAALLALTLSACGDDEEPAGASDPAPAGTTGSGSPGPAGSNGAAGSASTTQPGTGATGSGRPGGTGPTLVDARAELDAEDQSGDGSSVRLERVQLSSGSGHVAVFTADRRQLLGSARVTGGSQPVTVALDPPLASSAELLLVLFGDDGNGQLDPALDPVIVEEDGEIEDEDIDYRLG